VPVLTHTPPSMPGLSTTATFLPRRLDEMAAACPAGPVPMTIRSKSNLGGTAFMIAGVSGGSVGGGVLPLLLLSAKPRDPARQG
jgi:hypothetical protein